MTRGCFAGASFTHVFKYVSTVGAKTARGATPTVGSIKSNRAPSVRVALSHMGSSGSASIYHRAYGAVRRVLSHSFPTTSRTQERVHMDIPRELPLKSWAFLPARGRRHGRRRPLLPTRRFVFLTRYGFI